MNHGSLFSGIGGFDLASQKMGWNNIFHCENNKFCQQVLKYHFPKSMQYEDIKQTDFTKHYGQIDILTGGFPCQPFSLAGQRLGTNDDRHLWPEMLRAIREIKPRWIVGENVRGFVNWDGGVVFDQVWAELEAEGYEVLPFLLPACGVNAPHKRERVWIVAHSNGYGESIKPVNGYKGCGELGIVAHANNKRKRDGLREVQDKDAEVSERDNNAKSCYAGSLTDSRLFGQAKRQLDTMGFEQLCKEQFTTDPSLIELQGRMHEGRPEEAKRYSGTRDALGHKWTNWQNFPTQSPLCSRNDGFPSRLDGITFSKWRNESIKCFGNAIVPQIAFQIFKAIDQYNDITT